MSPVLERIEPTAQPSAEFPAIIELLHQMNERLERIERRLEPRQTRVSHAGNDLLRKLLPAIAGARGSEPFTTCELLADPILKIIVGTMGAKKLGKLLARSVDHDFNQLRIEFVTHENGVALWRVVKWIYKP